MKKTPEKKLSVETADVLKGIAFAPPPDEWLTEKCPTLADLLKPRWQGSKMTRQGGRIALRCESGSYQVTLECPTECVCTTIVVATLDRLWEALEAVVSNGHATWSPTWKVRKKNLPSIDQVV